MLEFIKKEDDFKVDVKVGNVCEEVNYEVTVKKEEPQWIEEEEIHLKTEENCLSETETKTIDQPTKPFRCQYCPYETKQNYNLNCHIKTIHKRATTFSCKQCKFVTYYKQSLNLHQRSHDGNVPFQCRECGKRFHQQINLDGHILSHHLTLRHIIKNRVYQCDSCDYATVYHTSIVRHNNRLHVKSTPRRYECKHCDSEFARKNDLLRHLFTHTKGKPHLCGQCDKAFKQKIQLDAHVLSKHPLNTELVKKITNEIRRCKRCDYTTTFLSRLRVHRKVHRRGKVRRGFC